MLRKIKCLLKLFFITFILCIGNYACLSDSFVEFVNNPYDQNISNEPAVLRAKNYLKEHGDLIGIALKSQTMQAKRVMYDYDIKNSEHVHFNRFYQGLPIRGGDFIVHADETGFQSFSVVNSRQINLDINPILSESEALFFIQTQMPGKIEKSTFMGLVVEISPFPVLAYEIEVVFDLKNNIPRIVWATVNATTGQIIAERERIISLGALGSGQGAYYHVPELVSTKKDDQFQLSDPNGLFWVQDVNHKTDSWEYNDEVDDYVPVPVPGEAMTDEDNHWGSGQNGTLEDPIDRQSTGVDVFYGLTKAVEYFSEVHQHVGFDGQGATTVARVHYGAKMKNAYYDLFSKQLWFGDGDNVEQTASASLDVTGHEYAHGVTDHTANLECRYTKESAALHEATSDIFGTMIEFYANHPDDPPDYLLGEMIYKTDSVIHKKGPWLRNMMKPSLNNCGQNGTQCGGFYGGMQEQGKKVLYGAADCWYEGIGILGQYAGIGIGTRFFYLLSEGSSNAPAPSDYYCKGLPPTHVNGIGNQNAAKIWFRALTRYMTSQTDYKHARKATLLAAKDLVDDYQIPLESVHEVGQAWNAVNVLPQFVIGDVNTDGVLSISDVQMLRAILNDPASYFQCEAAADVNGDRIINVSDAEMLEFWLKNVHQADVVDMGLQCQTQCPVANLFLPCLSYLAETTACGYLAN